MSHIIKPEDVYSDCEDEIEIVKKAFTLNGWEGDGEIGLIWIPPFVEDADDTYGRYIWHVKQHNNGISFLGFEESSLQSDDFAQRMENDSNYESVTITHDNTDGCLYRIKQAMQNLDDLAQFCTEVQLNNEELYQITLNAIQGNIVSDFIDCIDEIYLHLLIYVIECNNQDKLKLSKSNVKLPLDEISKGTDEGFWNSWLTLQTIISAIWKDFKFWQFKDKLKEVCRAIDYNIDDKLRNRIITQIEIRNSFQHHAGQFTSDMRRMIGQDHIDLLDEDGKTKRIKLFDRIVLSIPEIRSFCNDLKTLLLDYEKHISMRMQDREYRYEHNGEVSTFLPLKNNIKKERVSSSYSCVGTTDNFNYEVVPRRMELINYIYYLQYDEKIDDIVVKTDTADFVVYESSTFKVNYEECTSKEFYQILLSLGTIASCNGYEFEYDGENFVSKELIPVTEIKYSNIIQL